MNLKLRPAIEHVRHSVIEDVELKVMRLDSIHPIVGGNKLFKLKYNLQKAKEEKHDTLLTFGGAFSNHIAASAFAGKQNGFKTIGIIRGEEILPLNKTLSTAKENGMQFHFVDREKYRMLRKNPQLIEKDFANCYIIPEGGNNELGIKGCAEILTAVETDFDLIALAVGTGATLIGLAQSLPAHQSIIGISVIKNTKGVEENIQNHLSLLKVSNYQLNADYAFGGYAKSSKELDLFVQQFNIRQSFTIEPIYTGRLFYGLFDLIAKKYFKAGTRILAIHTGGLQYL